MISLERRNNDVEDVRDDIEDADLENDQDVHVNVEENILTIFSL